MKPLSRYIIYTMGTLLFSLSAAGMFYYGYKTFYIDSETTETTDYKYHFALIGEEKDNDYWRLIEKGAKQGAKENDIFMEYVAPQKADNEQALTLLDRTISSKVDGIIVQGIEGERFVDLVHKSVEQGIPIITVDTDVKSSERQAYVGTDNYNAGQLLGEALLENTSGEQYVGIVTGRFDAINQEERIEGFKEKIASHSRVEITETEASNITENGAARATYKLLKEYPEITALIGTSALDGIGMTEGLKDIASNKDVYIATFDLLPETRELIEEDKIDATIAQYPEEMGCEAIEVMMDLQENALVDDQTYTGSKIIRSSDLQHENKKDDIQ